MRIDIGWSKLRIGIVGGSKEIDRGGI